MKTLRLITAFLLMSLLTAAAQPGAAGPMSGMDLTLMKLFGGNKTFSAKEDMDVSGKDDPAVSLTADVAMLDGKMRTDIDMGQMKSKSMSAEGLDQMKK